MSGGTESLGSQDTRELSGIFARAPQCRPKAAIGCTPRARERQSNSDSAIHHPINNFRSCTACCTNCGARLDGRKSAPRQRRCVNRQVRSENEASRRGLRVRGCGKSNQSPWDTDSVRSLELSRDTSGGQPPPRSERGGPVRSPLPASIQPDYPAKAATALSRCGGAAACSPSCSTQCGPPWAAM